MNVTVPTLLTSLLMICQEPNAIFRSSSERQGLLRANSRLSEGSCEASGDDNLRKDNLPCARNTPLKEPWLAITKVDVVGKLFPSAPLDERACLVSWAWLFCFGPEQEDNEIPIPIDHSIRNTVLSMMKPSERNAQVKADDFHNTNKAYPGKCHKKKLFGLTLKRKKYHCIIILRHF